MFREVNAKVHYPKLEADVIEFWRRSEAFRKVQEMRRGGPVFTFYEGPPTANGRPHIGHVLPRSIKDLFPRYKTMQGYYVPRKAGWDTHGLPVELEVEKALGIASKPEIEDFGVEEFVEKCKESVWKYKEEWERLTERIGFWLDLDDAYVTYHTGYVESVWWALRQIWDKGWLYQGHRIVPYCARCGTSLSSHEVAQGYQEVEDPSVFVRFPLLAPLPGRDRTGLPAEWPVSLLVWTTTPWTLPSNTAVAIHPDIDYVAVVPEGTEEVLVVAAALAATVFADGYRAVHTLKGRDMIGLGYRPPFPFLGQAIDKGEVEGTPATFTLVTGDYVTLEDGTGLVHTAPAFGEDDMAAARQHGLPVFRPVDAAGRFTEAVKPWQGQFVKDADPSITDDLRDRGVLFRAERYKHSYPFCWRCHLPLLYFADTAWFIKMTAVKDELLRINREEVTWYPEHLREGRFGDWLENLVDWNLSRNRYWGTPLPVWECGGEGCGHRLCIGSIEELKGLARPETLPVPFDPHKPYIDRVIIPCPQCAGEMRRVPEVIDGWFDSGAMPFAQWHYPMENREVFERHHPADFICEAIDQTRGWFYSLLAISTVLFGRPAYRNVLVTEFGVDEDGRKMSKHLGNVLDPWEVLNVQGADALRWFIYAVSHPWFQKRFSSRAISEFQGRMQDTLWNVYSFFVLYARLDGFRPDPGALMGGATSANAATTADGPYLELGGQRHRTPALSERSVLDRWILSRLNGTIREVRESLDAYQVLPATRAIEGFVDDLSNWYVRRGRRRYWRTDSDRDKVAAFQTLYEVLVGMCRLLAPFVPLTTEAMYQNLVRGVAAKGEATGALGGADAGAAAGEDLPESVHHCRYPEADSALIDSELERRMAEVRQYIGLARAARNRAHIKTRQPLKQAVLVGPAARGRDLVSDLGDLLELLTDEVNVKEVAAAQDLGAYATYSIKPLFNIIGPRLGPLAPRVAKALAALPAERTAEAAAALAAGKKLELAIEGQDLPVLLGADDVEVRTESLPGWSVEGEDGRYVALDTEVSTELLWEGLAREMINRIQRMRKDAGFEVEDHIEVVYAPAEGASDLADALTAHRDYVASEVLAEAFGPGAVPEGSGAVGSWFVQVFDLEGEAVRVAVKKVG